MSSMVQVRGVPDDVRRVLKARAAAGGESLNSYLLDLLVREAARPRVAEVLERAARRAERATATAAAATAAAATAAAAAQGRPERIELPDQPAVPAARP